MKFPASFRTWKDHYLDSRFGRRFGADGWNVFWLAVYFLGVLFIAPPMLIPANLLAIVLAVTIAGADFAVGASLWAGAAYLAYRFPAVFAAVTLVSWLALAILSRRRPRQEPQESPER